MTVQQILDAILYRVGKRIITDFGEQFIIDTMDRIYHEVNEELRAVEKEYTFDFSTVADVETTPYMALPADWLYPFRIDPYKIYRDPSVYKDDEPNTCTYHNWRFYVAGVAADDSFDTAYYSIGDTLVNKTSPGTDEINTPEWKPTHLHSFLIYAVALELADNYPLRQQDEIKYARLYAQLDRRNWLKTLAHPTEEGPDIRQETFATNVDPYAI